MFLLIEMIKNLLSFGYFNSLAYVYPYKTIKRRGKVLLAFTPMKLSIFLNKLNGLALKNLLENLINYLIENVYHQRAKLS